jgi:hypothetical protein
LISTPTSLCRRRSAAAAALGACASTAPADVVLGAILPVLASLRGDRDEATRGMAAAAFCAVGEAHPGEAITTHVAAQLEVLLERREDALTLKIVRALGGACVAPGTPYCAFASRCIAETARRETIAAVTAGVETATRGDDAIEANRAWRRTFGEAVFRAASVILGSDDGRGGTHSALTPALEALLSDEHALDAAERSLAEATLRDPDVARSPEAKAASGGVERKKSYYQRAKKAVGFKSPTPVSTSTNAAANGDAGPKRKLTMEEMRAAIEAAEAEGQQLAGSGANLNAQQPNSPGVATVSLSELLDGGGDGDGGDAGGSGTTATSLGLDDSTLADDLEDDDEEVRAAAAAAAAVLASGGAVPSAAKKRSVFSAFKKK